jgi:CheY-like chemotaxis protein
VARVLVADNDVLIRGILRSALTGLGHSVSLAVNGAEAVAVAARQPADLVVLDLNMPHLNGLLACQQLRALPGYADTPIVILTGLDEDTARAAAARVGASGFIAKPFQLAPLIRCLSGYLDPDRASREQAPGMRVGRDTPLALM